MRLIPPAKGGLIGRPANNKQPREVLSFLQGHYSEQQRESRLKKKEKKRTKQNKASVSYGTITKDPTFTSLETPKRGEARAERKYLEIMD